MLRHTTPLVLLTAFFTLTLTVFGQERRDADRATEQQTDPQLIRILEIWSQQSKKVSKLKGEVARKEYDSAFAVERVGRGVFYYEAPDKGRLDMVPIKISEKELRERAEPGARVARDAKGNPFALESAINERWICDGQRVININDEEKAASIAELPESMQGEQIMNTPLPFLFGLPPDEALRRFQLELVDVQEDRVRIKAIPRLRQDGQSWKEAEVFLNTKTWLPTAVKLIDPAGTKKTVYVFTDMEVNAFEVIWWKDPFKVNLNGYKVEIIRADGGQNPEMPDLVGVPYTDAISRLKAIGIADDNIKKYSGGKAERAGDELRIRDQIPKPGTPVSDIKQVALRIWERQ